MTPPELRAWITSRLDSIADYDPSRAIIHSEHNLNAREPGYVFKPAAVLVPLVEHETGVTVLLTRRADALRSHSGQVAFPGGRCDPGEKPWETALREAHEEIGLDSEHVDLAGLSSVYRTRTGYEVTPVVGFVKPGFALHLNPDEVADVFETPFAFLMDPANHEERPMPDAIAKGLQLHFYAMTHEDRTIWGATAGMLRILYERLYGAEAASA